MIALNILWMFPKESGQTVKNYPSYASTKFQRPVINGDVTQCDEGYRNFVEA
jgi:hypothetical protein